MRWHGGWNDCSSCNLLLSLIKKTKTCYNNLKWFSVFSVPSNISLLSIYSYSSAENCCVTEDKMWSRVNMTCTKNLMKLNNFEIWHRTPTKAISSSTYLPSPKTFFSLRKACTQSLLIIGDCCRSCVLTTNNLELTPYLWLHLFKNLSFCFFFADNVVILA